MHSSGMRTARSSSRRGGGLDLIPLNFPLGCGPGSNPLNFPLGCGPGPDPPQFPSLSVGLGVSLEGGLLGGVSLEGSPWRGLLGGGILGGGSPWRGRGSPWRGRVSPWRGVSLEGGILGGGILGGGSPWRGVSLAGGYPSMH